MTSRRMHWLDGLVARTLSRRVRFFQDGWGPSSLIDRLTREPHGFALPELHEQCPDPDDSDGHVQAVRPDQGEEAGQEAAALRRRAFGNQLAELVELDANERGAEQAGCQQPGLCSA